MSFVEKLDPEALAFFNEIASKTFQEQAVAFLNAYWDKREVSSQAEWIYSVSWEMMKYADMHAKGVSLIHLYDEGSNVDFDIGLYFYEKLCKFVNENAKWSGAEYKESQPEMLTALKRKQELRDKVDVNFDGRVSMLEYLLYQYQAFANPADFARRAMGSPDEHPEVRKARLALEEVNRKIRAYEAERHRLTEGAKLPGVKGLQAKHQLSILDEGPIKVELNEALIHAEAAVRAATKKYGGSAAGAGGANGDDGGARTEGSLWWMNRDLEEKKRRYGR